MPSDENRIPIRDPNNVTEAFATSVVQVGLVSGQSVVVTLGMRRRLQPYLAHDPEETICISSRLVLTLDAAQNLMEALSAMLSRVQPKRDLDVTENTKQRSAKSH